MCGLRAIFTHIDEPMGFMVSELGFRRLHANVVVHMRQLDVELEAAFAQVGRNDPCPYGSGINFKKMSRASTLTRPCVEQASEERE